MSRRVGKDRSPASRQTAKGEGKVMSKRKTLLSRQTMMREPGFTVVVKRTKVQVAEVIVIHWCMQKMHCAQSPMFSRTVISPSGLPVPNLSIQCCIVMHYKHMSVLISDPHRTLASSPPDKREKDRTGGED